MKFRLSSFSLLGVMLCGSVAPAVWGQSFAGSGEPAEFEGVPAPLSTPNSSLYDDGMRAINDSRWVNAEAIFTMVADQHSDHSDGALYWKSYAQKKQGHEKLAIQTCAALANQYPASSWNHDCSALAIEIGAEDGKPVEPNALKDDDLRLLALNVLMQKDESQALAQIQEILNGDYSEKLKKEALFILGHHYSDETYAQIVRISYVEGDVRIARGEDKGKPASAVWEKAVANLPLETGFSLVTGAGRAEIEFEDDSTLYLGENSVLTFNDLHTTSGAPYTDLGLLTGTVSTNVFSNIAGEQFYLRTPTDTFVAKYLSPWNVRISSYLDGDAETEVSGRLVPVSGAAPLMGAKGQTQYLRDGHLVDFAGPKDDAALFADWDKWVADRVAQRTEANQEVMKASGLTTLIPGLADLKGQGTFFDCSPYGTCWEPKVQPAAQPPSHDGGQLPDDKVSQAWPGSVSAFAPGAHLVRADFHPATRFSGVQAQIGLPDPFGTTDVQDYFPCFPSAVRYRVARDPITGASSVVDSGIGTPTAGWNWAVCHAGSWVQRRHRYCWVVGHKRHHVAPVRWVKSEHKVGFVPIHPYDVKGRPPINRKEAVFALNNKNGLSIERLKFEPGKPIEELKSPPREFREAHLPPLVRAAAPHMEAHVMKDGPRGGKMTATKAVPLTFNAKAQTFNMSKEVVHGTKVATVSTPITNHGGTLQARGDSFVGGHGGFNGGHGGFSGGHGGYGGGGGARGGGSGGSGGSHGGGGSSGGGGGGGSHGGGGGGGSSGGGGASAGGGGGGGHR
jgi:FecR protein